MAAPYRDGRPGPPDRAAAVGVRARSQAEVQHVVRVCAELQVKAQAAFEVSSTRDRSRCSRPYVTRDPREIFNSGKN